MLKKIFNYKTLYGFVQLTMIGSCVFVAVHMILAPTVAPAEDVTVRVKSDYLLMLIQCLLGTLALLIPGILRRIAKINIPSMMIIMYALFLYCAIYLGEVRNFYFVIPHWDVVLHAFSGAALGALGFSLVSILNKSESIEFTLSPLFVALFAFCFALSLGVIWEVYEFAIDNLLNTNSQKYALEYGEMLVGKAALTDTMKDLIVDAIGAFAIAAVGFVSLKYKKGWLDRFRIKKS